MKIGAYITAGIDGPAPCDDCRFRSRCRDEQLACDAFGVFIKTANEKRWRAAPRIPTAATFERLGLDREEQLT
jgi:hypothetical protein